MKIQKYGVFKNTNNWHQKKNQVEKMVASNSLFT
jgi:hypothetical protein